MKAVVQRAKEFLVSESGPTAVEYAVMLALIIIVAIVAIQLLGTTVRTMFNTIATELAKVPITTGL